MRRAVGVVWFSIRAVYGDLFVLVGIGGVWLAASVLLPALVFWFTGPLTSVVAGLLNLGSLVLMPPCTAAVYDVAFRIAREKRIEFGHLWQGFKTYWKASYKVAGLLGTSGAIIVFSVLFYFGNNQNTLFMIAGVLVLAILAFWFCFQIYLWPLLISQEEKRIALMVKNAGLFALSFPFFTLCILIVIALATVLSVAVPILALVWMPFVSILCSRSFASSLQEVKRLQRQDSERDTDTDV